MEDEMELKIEIDDDLLYMVPHKRRKVNLLRRDEINKGRSVFLQPRLETNEGSENRRLDKTNDIEQEEFSCDKCSHIALNVESLKLHKDKKHAGISYYPCDLCDHKATSDRLLKRHRDYKHKSNRNICNQRERDDFSVQIGYFIEDSDAAEDVNGPPAKPPVLISCSAKSGNQCDPVLLTPRTESSTPENKISNIEPNESNSAAAIVTSQKSKKAKKVKTDVPENVKNQTDNLDQINAILRLRGNVFGDNMARCDQCDFVTKYPENLIKHKKTKVHTKGGYFCDECDHVARGPGSIKEHKIVKHGSVDFNCKQCDYTTLEPQCLRIHKETKHNQCGRCDFSATSVANLVQHKKSAHDGWT